MVKRHARAVWVSRVIKKLVGADSYPCQFASYAMVLRLSPYPTPPMPITASNRRPLTVFMQLLLPKTPALGSGSPQCVLL
jgi:hypothetical protein